jgi:hypothetical protein
MPNLDKTATNHLQPLKCVCVGLKFNPNQPTTSRLADLGILSSRHGSAYSRLIIYRKSIYGIEYTQIALKFNAHTSNTKFKPEN